MLYPLYGPFPIISLLSIYKTSSHILNCHWVYKSRSSLILSTGISDVECIEIRRPIGICCLLLGSRKIYAKLLFYAFSKHFYLLGIRICHFSWYFKRKYVSRLYTELNALKMTNRYMHLNGRRTHSSETTESHGETD